MSRTLLVGGLMAISALPSRSAERLQIDQKQSDLVRVSLLEPEGGPQAVHRLEIDDAAGFRTPILTRSFHRTLDLNLSDAGLIPGVTYRVRVDHSSSDSLFRPRNSPIDLPDVNCRVLHDTWEATGRLMTGVAFSGVRWDATANRWLQVPHSYLVGQSLYNVELYLRPALQAARACGDLHILDEIAQYYLVMLQQTETVGALLKRPKVTAETRQRLASVDHSARTFAAYFGDEVGEGELYNAQWMHPAAQLVRLISLWSAGDRTPAMKDFLREYPSFLVKEQLNRYLVQQSLAAPGGGIPVARMARWELAMRGLKGPEPWDTAMSDIDLWLLASAAEILGAHGNDPEAVRLDNGQIAMLHRAIDIGIRFFQTKRTGYTCKDLQGRTLVCASYFNGDYAAHPDYAYSGVDRQQFPLPSEQRSLPDVSWDISHAYRLPVFLRSLYENRKATRTSFPELRDLQQVVNQYVYRVFNGDFSYPLFHNYLDGGDGWHRVGFNGPGFGYPPSRHCDMRIPRSPCLIPGSIIGWGELAFVNPDLARLERSLVKLGFDGGRDANDFRDRYYFYKEPYRIIAAEEKPSTRIYGAALYFVVAENAEMIANSTR